MDSLLIGVLIAQCYLSGVLDKIFKQRQGILFLLLTISFLLLFFIKGSEKFGGTYIHSILALLYGTVLVIVLMLNKNNFIIKALSSALMSFVARISYMIYLTHQIFSGLLHQFVLNQDPYINDYEDAIVTVFALIATLLFSIISYYSLEKPILNLGKKYKY